MLSDRKFRLLPQGNRQSFFVMLILITIIILGRILTLKTDELSWDVLGYYIHLPALFIYNDYGLSDLGWIHTLLDKYHFTGTLYQISTGPDNNPIFFFLMGMAILYSPWFFVGHFSAQILGYPVDGFSLPYQYALALGAIVYTIIGLVYLRKILLNFFSQSITIITMIIIVLATNYLHFMTVKNLETANALFMFITLITWNTIQWHKNHKQLNLILLSAFIVLMALCKPSEVMVVLIPLLWGVYDKITLKAKFKTIYEYKGQFIIAFIVAFIIALPQMLYWFKETGYFIYDSYKNPGVGLDLTSPHIIPILFSYKKGWLVYTPVMVFSLIGFFFLYKKNKGLFFPIFSYSILAFYIIASWTEWWYGASFSIRPMITLYPLFAIAMASLFEYLKDRTVVIKSVVGLLVVFFMLLNLFQTWQLNKYILDPYRTNKNYYFAIFGKTKITEAEGNLLSADFSGGGNAKFPGESYFRHKNIGFYNFDEYGDYYSSHLVSDSLKGRVLKMDSTYNFSPEISLTYESMTSKEYVWIFAEADVFIPYGYKEELPLLVMTFERREGSYFYHSYGIDTTIYKPGSWGKIKAQLMTNDVRSKHDKFKIYIWQRGKMPVYIDNLKADLFEPK